MDNLELALENEKNALALNSAFAKIFNSELFLKISEIRNSGISILENILEKTFEVEEKKFDNLSYDDALVLALANEIEICMMYENITQNEKDEKLKDLFFRLWATSENEYKKALKNELFMKKEDLNLQNGFNEINEILNKFSQGKFEKKDLFNFMNSPNLSIFSGMAVGSLGGFLLNDFIEKKGE